MTAPPAPMPSGRRRRMLPPLLVAAVALGYVGIGLWSDAVAAEVPGRFPPLAYAVLVGVQAFALRWRGHAPLRTLGVVVAADLMILGTTAGELGVGALGVLFAAYAVARRWPRRAVLTALAIAGAATAVVGTVAMALASREPLAIQLATVVTRLVVLYVAPAAVAEQVRGRERLREALREQERLETARHQDRADREVRAERSALARELHDIAGHHLSGIIVSAQAATALLHSDPERAREMLRTIQGDARLTLADLRRTVGLLRSEDDEALDGPAPAPTIAGIDTLVDRARDRGVPVELEVTGPRRTLGPLAEATAYRMVQESVANTARHAPGARCEIRVSFSPERVDLTVTNAPAAGTARPTDGAGAGYGLSGMAERAELIGAQLTTGPTTGGGWTNRLVIPAEGRSAP